MSNGRAGLLKSSPSSRYVGNWVQVEGNGLGFGFCKAKLPNGAQVVYVDIPGVAEKRVVVPLEQITFPRFSLGTPVWIKGAHYGWVAAEIVAQTGFSEYWVRVSGSGTDVRLPGARLMVRWNRPLCDPVEALATGLCDSPEYYTTRRDFFEHLVRQRGASRGLTAAMSAPIKLYQHQLDTAARVLGDPVMRYLLADEVGLGKTIEAGLVLRQLLLDDPKMVALVSVPATLVEQWQEELTERLALGTAIEQRRVLITRHEELPHRKDLGRYGLVIVDEAHKTIRPLREAPRIWELLQRTRALLLLSATPMRGDLTTFLGLLNLIDPVAFPIADETALRERMEHRASSANSVRVLGLRRATPRQRRNALADLESLHGSDQVFARMAQQCRAADESDIEVWRTLAEYVRETYRISRRMIRHRRGGESARGYPVAGRRATYIQLADPAREIADQYLESLRERWTGSDDGEEFAKVVNVALAGPQALAHYLRNDLAVDPAAGPPAHLRALAERTAARLAMADIGTRQRTALDVVDDRVRDGHKVVVVGTATAVVADFLAAASDRWAGKVRGHLVNMSRLDRNTAVEDFLESRVVQVLVGDFTLEEGRNLQRAQVLVNLDLPLDVNRLEQRIGRLDRFTERGDRAEVVVFEEPDSDWQTRQVELLRDGVGIFADSVATLQIRLNRMRADMIDSLIERGSQALAPDLQALRTDFENEREQVDLLEELESVTTATDFDDAGMAELTATDDDAAGLRAAFKRLTSSRRGGIWLKPVDGKPDGLVRFEVGNGKSGHAQARRVPGLSEAASQEVIPLLGTSRAYARDVAVSERKPLLRIGEPLVDWLDQHLRMDERGRTRAIVRKTSAVELPELWLACDFLVEFDAAHLDAETPAVRRRLRRRGDALLPPEVIRTWTSIDGVANPRLAADVLDTPFTEGADHVLRGPNWAHVLGALPDWAGQCRASYQFAEQHLRAHPGLTERPAEAARRAEVEVNARLKVLLARSHRLPTAAEREGAKHDMDREEALGAALVKGIIRPAVSVVACGGVVLWPAS
ncbi:SNF2-related protein [Crossiella sp. SN42]|uniref:protein DpdE n=1 Tax=Crossiella sp. SN42 TaxID=2944808 RepID=UPI00207CBC40|nr:protein DpdE [Crossiella sp. SN42]MCO1574257.1 SNF2-related protein [Crossiella sp. SN42]